ncbi:uncharacterized protein ARMOST_16166 [Armillaria ostoyae]|uniref:Uncharacterized protein n=1 Tax=Armillaria ostoyae TaxID=47428 RepID=A0A284RVJ3_ARMOS|nr:uncharacterized protein ARMOST_16166 [Armillaria ostoyae]
MSLTNYKAPDTLTTSIRQDSFKQTFRAATAPLIGLPGDLGLHDSVESILDTFVVDAESSDDFVFLANKRSGGEEVFQVRGEAPSSIERPKVFRYIKRLQALINLFRVSINELIQTVRLVSFDEDEWFRKATTAASRIAKYMEQHVQETVQIPYAVRHGAIREFQIVNRILTLPHRTAVEDVIELPLSYDPSRTLQPVIGEGKFIFTKDNKPSFEKFSMNEDGQYVQHSVTERIIDNLQVYSCPWGEAEYVSSWANCRGGSVFPSSTIHE